MAFGRDGGPRKGKGFGQGGGGGYSKGPRREGGDRPYTPRPPREGGDRPYTPRPPREGGDRPYTPRGPRAEGGERSYSRPYTPRPPREGGDRPYTPRPPREGGDRPAYKPRFDRGERPAYGGDKPRYPRRDEGGEGGEGRVDFKNARFAARKPRQLADFEQGGDQGGYTRVAKAKPGRFAQAGESQNDFAPADNQDGWLIGTHAVMAALTSGRRKVREIWLMADAQGALAELIAANPDWVVSMKTRPDFTTQFGDAVHQGVAALVGNLRQPPLPEVLAQKPRLLVALDQVTDPHNLGAIVRSAAAFGAGAVLVTEHRSAGVNSTAAKVAAGALETVPVVEIVNLVSSLKMLQEAGYVVVGLAGEAEVDLATFQDTRPVCLVLGSEGEGLRRLTRETCDVLAKIGISSAVESLNVSVAGGVAMSMLRR